MKLKVAFICIHNSCRSQMAEGYLKYYGSDLVETYSAGTKKYPQVKPKAVEAMLLDGVDVSMQYPKLLTDIPSRIDILITLGCGVSCPYIPCKYRTDWGLEDPSGGSLDDFIVTRDLIKKRVLSLIDEIKNNKLKNLDETTTINLSF